MRQTSLAASLTEREKVFLKSCFEDSVCGIAHECVGFEGIDVDMLRSLESRGLVRVTGPHSRPPLAGPVYDCLLTMKGIRLMGSIRTGRMSPIAIQAVRLQGFLSYGEKSKPIELGRLNVIIGANGSGKSNFIDALCLLRAMPSDIQQAIRVGGGVDGFLSNIPGSNRVATIEVLMPRDNIAVELAYKFSFASVGGRFHIIEERLENRIRPVVSDVGEIYFSVSPAGVLINDRGRLRRLMTHSFDREQSMLAQRRDPDVYPALSRVADVFSSMYIYREWQFGRKSDLRMPGKIDLPSTFLLPDCSNLALVLSSLQRLPLVKRKIVERLRDLYGDVTDYFVQIDGGVAQVFLMEGERPIPLSRISDGTLRYLCLLVILCHPNPPSLICLEEPEMGLHPDVIPQLGELLVSASRKCQLIVTTHSDILVDSLSDTPESVIVAERDENGTKLRRLASRKLKPWLEKYRLGTLWLNGHLGGARW